MHLPDGSPDPRVQVAIAESRTIRFLQQLTGSGHHPGDTLVVDLDLSAGHLPAGARLRVGGAMVEVSDVENDGCAKFAKHYGDDVLAWIRAAENRDRRLRGLFARVIEGGTVRDGDPIAVIPDR
jgi:MOSC domain-containing protein YiiM